MNIKTTFFAITALALTTTAGFADGLRMTAAGPVLDVALIDDEPETLGIASAATPGDNQTHTVKLGNQVYAVYDSVSSGGQLGDPIYAVRRR